MYTNKRTALASPAKGGAPIPKDVETMSRKSLGAPMEETRKETESPYAAFDRSLDEQDLLRESKKVARRLLIDPIDKFIDEEENVNTPKASTQASCIERRQEKFKNAAQKKTGLSGATCTSVEVFDTEDAENDGIYRREYDNDDEDFSYHSSDGLDKDDSVYDLSLGNGAEGTSPPATARNTDGQFPLG